MLNDINFVGVGFVQGKEGCINKNNFVLGMIHDVRQLIGKKANVEGVTHRPRPRDSKIQLHMLVVIPGKGANAIPHLNAQLGQRFGKAFDALIHIRIGVGVIRAIREHGGDFFCAVEAVGMLQNSVEGQLIIHH